MEDTTLHLKFITSRLLSPSSWLLNRSPTLLQSVLYVQASCPLTVLQAPWALHSLCVLLLLLSEWFYSTHLFQLFIITLQDDKHICLLSTVSLLWPCQPRQIWQKSLITPGMFAFKSGGVCVCEVRFISSSKQDHKFLEGKISIV